MLKIFSRYISIKAILLLITENLWITGMLVLLVWLRARYLVPTADFSLAAIAGQVALVTLLWQVSLFYNDLYDLSVVSNRRELVIRTLQSFGAGALAIGLIYAAFPRLMIGNGVVAAFVVVGVFVLLGWRMAFAAVSRAYEMPSRVIILGTGELALELVRCLRKRPDLNLNVVGLLTDHPEQVGTGLAEPQVIGTVDQLEEMVKKEHAERVVVALRDRRNNLPVGALLRLKFQGVVIDDAHSLYEKVAGKIRTTALPPSWLIFSEGFHAIARKAGKKRVLDFCLGVAPGLVLLPVAIVVAALVKISSKGPVLFQQERVGLRGRVFHLHKFRTMRVDAEADGQPKWAEENDPRITRIGALLRKTRLDEIPQIWNVVRGDMSFVGPRPERPYFVDLLSRQLPYYSERHWVRPGITGWAQINYPYGSSVEDALEKLQYDLFYVKNMSLALDLAILFETGKIVLFGRGR